MCNQASALEHKDFMSQALQELEKNRCIIRVPERPYICSSLSVVAKFQLVINLHYLKQFLYV